MRVCGNCEEAGADAVGISGDVASESFVRELAERLMRDYGALDALVNNAGISLIAPAESISAEQWQRVMNVNLFGPFLLCKYLGAQMLSRGRGSIVNVASVAGLSGIAHRSAYNASKHGLIGLTRTLAAEWGGRGIRVNAVCPGWIKTEMDVEDQGGGAYSDADIVNRVPMGALCERGGCCAGDRLAARRGALCIHQRSRAPRRWRLDRRWRMGELAGTRPELTTVWLRETSPDERHTLIAACLGYGLDGFDFVIYTFIMPTLLAVWHITKAQAGYIAAGALIASAVGGLGGGRSGRSLRRGCVSCSGPLPGSRYSPP